MQIEWQDIAGYIGVYQVSNTGDIKSLDRINEYGYHLKERVLKQTTDKNGYKRVYLTKHAKTKSFIVSRLVAQAFIPNPNHLPEVNHKDENKSNNRVNNLEWCTHKYNSNYGTRTARIIPQTIDKTRTPIDQYTMDGVLIKEWYSTNEAARTLGLVQQNLTKCCQGRRKSAGGYVWKYHIKGGD